MNWKLSTNERWIGLSTFSGSNNGSVIINIDASYLSPGNYIGTVNITSNGGNEPLTISLNIPSITPTITPTVTSTVTPTVTSTVSPTVSPTVTSTVTPPVLSIITVSSAPGSVDIGGTKSFTAYPKDQSGNPMTVTVTWTSSDLNVGTIDNTGLFTAKASGTTTITAASGTVSGTATVTVTTPSRLTIITVTPATASVVAGNPQSFSAIPKDQSGNPMTVTVTWTSSDSNVGTIDNTGLFTAKIPGTTTITAASGTVSGTATVTVTINMEFIRIPSNNFMMGSPSTDVNSYDSERPVHLVMFANPFYLGKYEVTQKQWRDIMGTDPSYFTGDDLLPVEQVSWNDVQQFIAALNTKEGTTKYRLPSEAEWEYAARAGTSTIYSFGDSNSNLGIYAWYFDNSVSKTHPVGQKSPNPLGLYDMHGNVLEWVKDTWHTDYIGAPGDGSSWETGTNRVFRGGSWAQSVKCCRSAARFNFDPDHRDYSIGFRLVRDV